MIRSNGYIGQRRRVVRYTAEQWADMGIRTQALADARAAARELRGEIIIKVGRGRTLTKVASIKYVEARGGFSTSIRHLPGKF